MGLRKETRGPVLVVTLDRPRTRNALDMATLRVLGDVMDAVAFREPLPPERRRTGGAWAWWPPATWSWRHRRPDSCSRRPSWDWCRASSRRW